MAAQPLQYCVGAREQHDDICRQHQGGPLPAAPGRSSRHDVPAPCGRPRRGMAESELAHVTSGRVLVVPDRVQHAADATRNVRLGSAGAAGLCGVCLAARLTRLSFRDHSRALQRRYLERGLMPCPVEPGACRCEPRTAEREPASLMSTSGPVRGHLAHQACQQTAAAGQLHAIGACLGHQPFGPVIHGRLADDLSRRHSRHVLIRHRHDPSQPKAANPQTTTGNTENPECHC